MTFNTHKRARILATDAVHARFRAFAENAAKRQITVGRYVLMPDHAHVFIAGSREFVLAAWVRMLKLSLSSAITAARPHWQEGFFDHLLRHDESYSEKAVICLDIFAVLRLAAIFVNTVRCDVV